MYHPTTVASPSHPPAHDSSSPSLGPFSFPTSDLRSTPPRPMVPPTTRVPPPYFTAPSSPSVDQTTSEYSTPVPVWEEIDPGVWFNGTDRVLSSAYPAVQDFLAVARQLMSLPVPPSELIFVIAALDVFYNKNDPVHWMFWSDEKKYQTATVVNRIALRSPQLFRSKVAWNGIPEYLFILSGLHGSSSLPTDKDWYHMLNPSKVPSPPMNLRKRKVQQVEQTEFLDMPEDEDDSEPRPKRSKTRSTRNVRSRTVATPEPAKLNSNDFILSEASPASTTISLPTEDTNTLRAISQLGSPPEHTISPIQSSASAQRKPSHQKPNARQSSSTPDPLTLPGAASPSPVSGLITSTSTISHTRNRSFSQASSQTLVSTDERRSVSVLSNITAVEDRIVCGGAEDTIKVDHSVSDSEEVDGKAEHESPSGMVTRGRANKARSTLDQSKGASQPPKRRDRRRAAK
ncbi:hypothetical protein FPV67DRAFT_1028145 [Lyophyllum atratum]|nr:hypothetical protein FPV67DRAFT_1028145 [Lyophyllum atratum]